MKQPITVSLNTQDHFSPMLSQKENESAFLIALAIEARLKAELMGAVITNGHVAGKGMAQLRKLKPTLKFPEIITLTFTEDTNELLARYESMPKELILAALIDELGQL